MISIAEKFASFIFNLSFEELGSDALLTIKRSFIDSLGVTIAGSSEESSLIVKNYVKTNNCSPNASVIAGGFKTSAADAALCNGVALHAHDFDDTGAYTQGHPSAAVFPAIISIAEENENSGKEIVEAYIVGVEVLSRLSRLMPMLHLKGFHPTSVFGSVAAAAAVSKLLKLNQHEIKNAIGIAASLSSGLIKNFGTMSKHLQTGNAAKNGIMVARLAQNNFTASENIFDDELSFQVSFKGEKVNSTDDIINAIGNPLAVVSPGINFKKYPSCSLTHRSIDALVYLKHKHNLDHNLIKNITCRVSPRAVKVLFYNNPITGLEAKFSMQFVVAAALYFDELTLSHFTKSHIQNPVIQSLMKKISLKIHDDWKDGDDARADIVDIMLNDGTVLSHSIEIPKGNTKNPLSIEEVISKFNLCTEQVLTTDTQLEIVNSILNLENLSSIKPLIELVPFTSKENMYAEA